MKTKLFLFTLFLLCSTQFSSAQVIRRSIVNSEGTTLTNSGIRMTISVGEPHVQKYSPGIIMYQGFLQPLPPMEPRATEVIERNETNAISLFPNPVNEYLFIQSRLKVKLNCSIANFLGQKIKEVIPEQGRVFMGDLSQGMYFVTLSTRDHSIIQTFKIIKQ